MEKEAKEKGEILPTESRFDSNCISPGTEFMERLHDKLKYFVVKKLSEDAVWQVEGLKVYLSGHNAPGEGEHKAMDFIRYVRSQEGYVFLLNYLDLWRTIYLHFTSLHYMMDSGSQFEIGFLFVEREKCHFCKETLSN